MSDGPVNVRFPDKMTVDAPQLERLVKELEESMSNSLSQVRGEVASTNQQTKQVALTVAAMQAAIVAELGLQLKKMHEVRNEIEATYVREVECRALEGMGEIESLRGKGDGLSERLSDKVRQLNDDKRRVVERFFRTMEDLAREVEGRIRELDSHALQLLEKTFATEIEEPVKLQRALSFALMDFVPSESAETRTIALETRAAEVLKAIRAFVRERETFFNDVSRRWLVDDVAPGEYEIPFSIIDIRDHKTGQIKRMLAFDGASINSLPHVAQEQLTAEANAAILRNDRKLGEAALAELSETLSHMPGVDARQCVQMRKNGTNLIEVRDGTT